MSTLIIVESPTKVKTIKKYLGGDYEVMASKGHIRDLPKTLLGVDIAHDFKPHYVDIPGKSALLRQLKQVASESDRILLATDPDREGEAISWHLAQVLGVDLTKANRVTFNEITKTGIEQGMQRPHMLDMDMVDAQQARRILDRIVGYKISPFLWKKVRKGLSAGRVQSAAVRIIMDREEEIRAFVSEEYWSIDAAFSKEEKGKSFAAKLFGTAQGKLKIENEEQTNHILAQLKNEQFRVAGVKKSVRRLQPAPPFITSTLQQEASRRLGFATRRTMQTAQELYEGVEIKDIGAIGLITYMRTDSLRISEEARTAGNDYIKEHYGPEYLPEKPRYFKSRDNAQDAHEAIRPSVPSLTPEQVRGSLSSDQYKLYRLIWERFIASLMANCLQDTCQTDIAAGDYIFKASGYTVRFDGYTVLYVEAKDEESETDGPLPPLKEGDTLCLNDLRGNRHFTQPPPRYTEATLIKAFVEKGIGRPSTYDPTISTILSRGYVERNGKALVPTALGEVTNTLMKENFPEIVDVKFTAQMESNLDSVEKGKENWVNTLRKFYGSFEKTLKKAETTLTDERIKVPEEETDVVCELCGRNMVIKVGRYGKFLACPGYPDCKNTKQLVERTDGVCPLCGGAIIAKRSKNNRKFYGCANYPKCHFVSWNEPSGEVCPRCGKTLFKKQGKNPKLYCQTEGCGFEKATEK